MRRSADAPFEMLLAADGSAGRLATDDLDGGLSTVSGKESPAIPRSGATAGGSEAFGQYFNKQETMKTPKNTAAYGSNDRDDSPVPSGDG